MSEKVDLKRSDAYQARAGEFRFLDVPEQRYLMIDGAGDPNTSRTFSEAVESLYPVAYGMKFASKNDLGRDYVVPPLEGLWWAEDMSLFTGARDKTGWSWTLMLVVPPWIPEDVFRAAVARAAARKRPPRLDDVHLAPLAEGRCVQTLHVGPFDDEAAVLAHLHDVVLPGHGLRMTGKHHEIYLSDFRRTAPAKQRTILRQPVTATRQ
ncbi:hypothetical protein SAMN05660485_00037 [Blastococcus fimeti]|nr:hypothetical protein SAMN05660485_00037 [Blastococcus fimeti]